MGIFTFLLFLFSSILVAQPAPPAGKKWQKVENMSDEFNGNSLNTTKWDSNDPQWEGRRPARFERSAVSVGGGNLRIVASKKSNPFGGWTHNGGLVRSKAKITYGYFETRMKGNRTALSSTFWLINKRNDAPRNSCDYRTTELDITENVGVDAHRNQNNRGWVARLIRTINSNTHSRGVVNGNCGTPQGQKGGQTEIGENSWEGYHTYGVWWKGPKELIFYVDGREAHRITPVSNFNLGMYLRMVVESYDWNKPRDGFDNMNLSQFDRTTFYDWTRSYRLVNCSSNCGNTGGNNNGGNNNGGNNGGGSACNSNAIVSGLAVSKSGTSATLTFNNLSGARTYEVRSFVKGTHTGGISGSGPAVWASGNSSPITINNLGANTQYTVVVRAICNSGVATKISTVDTSSSGGNSGGNNANNGGNNGGNGNAFFVVNRQTGKKLAPQNNSDGAQLIQVDASNNNNIAKWTQVNTSGGYFYLQNRQTNLYFRPNGDGNNSTMVQRPTSYGGNYTQWIFQSTSAKSLSSDLGISIINNPIDNGAIELSNADNVSYSVSTITGEVVEAGTVANNFIDVSNLTSGMYIVQFVKEGNIHVEKIIIN